MNGLDDVSSAIDHIALVLVQQQIPHAFGGALAQNYWGVAPRALASDAGSQSFFALAFGAVHVNGLPPFAGGWQSTCPDSAATASSQ